MILSFVGCGSNSTSTSNSTGNTSSKEVTSDASTKNERISFDINDKSGKTYKEHVQDLWSKTKVLLIEDAKKSFSDEEYMQLGKEFDKAWVNLQAHTSLPTNKHDEAVEDTGNHVLGNMTGNILGDIDQIYGERSTYDSKKEREDRRKNALSKLSNTIEKYDDKLSKLTIK